MASATEYFGASFTNLGPLTSTWTAPESCATNTVNQYFGVERDLQGIDYVYGRASCGPARLGECVPSGSAIDEFKDSINSDAPLGVFWYHSPGIACPKDWTTAAMIAKGDGNTAEDVSGFLTIGSDADRPTGLGDMGFTDLFLGFLEPSQTMAFCCPSGWDGDRFGACKSTVGPFTSADYSTICSTFFEYRPSYVTVNTVDGTDMGTPYLSVLPETESRSYETFTYTVGSNTEVPWNNLSVVTQLPAVPLVFGQDDLDKAEKEEEEKGDKAEGEEENTEGEEEEEPTAVNAAPQLSVRGLVPVLTVLGSMFAGAGIFMY